MFLINFGEGFESSLAWQDYSERIMVLTVQSLHSFCTSLRGHRCLPVVLEECVL